MTSPARVDGKDAALRWRVRAALRKAIRTPGGPSAKAVARAFDLHVSTLRELCPRCYRKLVEVRGEERAQVKAKRCAAIEEEALCSAERPSACSVARGLRPRYYGYGAQERICGAL